MDLESISLIEKLELDIENLEDDKRELECRINILNDEISELEDEIEFMAGLPKEVIDDEEEPKLYLVGSILAER